MTVWLIAISALLVLGLLAVVVPTGMRVYKIGQFREEERAVDALVAPWEHQPPAGVDPHVWREVCVVVDSALGNVCYSPDHVSIEEMGRLRADVEAKSREPVTLDKLDWLWQRLRQTGPHGAKYIDQMQPLWEEAKQAASTAGAIPATDSGIAN